MLYKEKTVYFFIIICSLGMNKDDSTLLSSPVSYFTYSAS